MSMNVLLTVRGPAATAWLILSCLLAILGCEPGAYPGFGARFQGGGAFRGSNPVICPNGEDVVCALPGQQRSGHIDLLPIEMGAGRTIVNSADYLGFPDISPDGHMIVYVSESTGVPTIWISDNTGANARRLTNSKCPEETPIFSGDGKSIAFVRRMSLADSNYRESELFVIGITGQSEKRLTEDHHADSPVKFSLNGTEIYFLSNRSWQDSKARAETAQLFKMSLANLSISPVLKLDLRAPSGCDLSMDEKTVVFVTDPKKDFAYDAFTCNLDGTDRKRRTKLGSYIGSVRFGFHSDRFALEEERGGGGSAGIFVYDLKSSSIQKVKSP